MNFRNPWIDPRVQAIRPFQLLAYLQAKKWSETRARFPTMRAFRDAYGHGDVLVPVTMDHDRYVEDIIDAVTLLAKAEGRYAGDVLTDLLSQTPADAEAKTMPPASAEKSDGLTQAVSR